MAPILHFNALSPPVRAVLLVTRALGVKLNLKEVNLFAEEHLKDEFVKLNPQHTVPTLEEEDGFIIWDSHAISSYLVSKYGTDDLLYPKDLRQRALVDQRLHFDSGILFPRLRGMFFPILFLGEKTVSQEKIEGIHEAYALLEKFLDGNEWMTGHNTTIADLCIIASVTSINIIVPVEEQKYPQLAAWINKCKNLPYYADANEEGLTNITAILKSKMS